MMTLVVFTVNTSVNFTNGKKKLFLKVGVTIMGFFYLRISGPPTPPPPLQNGKKSNLTTECIVTYTEIEQKYGSAHNLIL